MRRALPTLAAVLAVAIVVAPGVGWAHNAGRVELLVTNLKFTHDTGPGLMVRADLIDRDSGASAAGFAITVSARKADGASAGPVTLTDARGTGHYEGRLAVAPGAWTVTAKAEQGTSALPAIGSNRTAEVRIDESGAVAQGGGHGGGSNLGLWVAMAAAALVVAAGGFLMMTRKTGGAATQPMGQRV
ncbi:MAG TPA: hypothetical protein VGR20_14275 [Acidimicrobiia bacterium]|nr:hypothetical protein [Acidimicrobiia bacterium]